MAKLLQLHVLPSAFYRIGIPGLLRSRIKSCGNFTFVTATTIRLESENISRPSI
jgi:hypothetical protein